MTERRERKGITSVKKRFKSIIRTQRTKCRRLLIAGLKTDRERLSGIDPGRMAIMSTYTEYHRQYYLDHKQKIVRDTKERRELLIKCHMCRECGKQDAYTLNGHTKCADCVERDTERRREQRGYQPAWAREKKPEKTINYPRGANGICWTCNKKPRLEGKKLCAECYGKAVENAKKASRYSRKNHPWKKRQEYEIHEMEYRKQIP